MSAVIFNARSEAYLTPWLTFFNYIICLYSYTDLFKDSQYTGLCYLLLHLQVQYAEFCSDVKARRKSMWFIESYLFISF